VNRFQVVYLHVCVVLTALTGIVFAVMKYLMKPADDFSVINYPLQPHMLSAHVIVAPFVLFGFGWVFGNHVWPKLIYREQRKRASGIWSLAAIAPMTLSGYLLQISTADATRHGMAVVHWISSAFFVAAYAVHWINRAGREGDRSDSEAGAVNVPSPT
jgi:hypothetical protein